MKLSILCLMLLVTLQSQAGQLEQDIIRLSQMVDLGTNGGSFSVVNYDLSKFNLDLVTQGLTEEVGGNSCEFTILKNQKDVISSDFMSLPKEAKQLIKKLEKNGSLKAAAGYNWDGANGYPENCYRESVLLYFSNGQALLIAYDSTT